MAFLTITYHPSAFFFSNAQTVIFPYTETSTLGDLMAFVSETLDIPIGNQKLTLSQDKIALNTGNPNEPLSLYDLEKNGIVLTFIKQSEHYIPKKESHESRANNNNCNNALEVDTSLKTTDRNLKNTENEIALPAPCLHKKENTHDQQVNNNGKITNAAISSKENPLIKMFNRFVSTQVCEGNKQYQFSVFKELLTRCQKNTFNSLTADHFPYRCRKNILKGGRPYKFDDEYGKFIQTILHSPQQAKEEYSQFQDYLEKISTNKNNYSPQTCQLAEELREITAPIMATVENFIKDAADMANDLFDSAKKVGVFASISKKFF